MSGSVLSHQVLLLETESVLVALEVEGGGLYSSSTLHQRDRLFLSWGLLLGMRSTWLAEGNGTSHPH